MKVAVVGEATSGKTAFVQMALSGGVTFPKNYMMTVGCDLSVKEVNVDMATTVEMSVFDVGGHDLYRPQAPEYIVGLTAFILVYDVANKATFETCKRWVEICRKANPNCIGYLVANKIDLADKAEVTDNQGEVFARGNNMRLFKASSLRGVGINEPIDELARQHIENFNDRCRLLDSLQ
jgi:transport family protein 27